MLHDKGDFGFDPRLDEATTRNRSAIGEKHILEQHAAVRDIDIQRILHGLRCQPDFPPPDVAARREFALYEIRLHGIGVSHVHTGMCCGNQGCLRPVTLGGEQRFAGSFDLKFSHDRHD